MYIEMRITSACQSVASAFSDAVLRHWLYHCRPWLLMPRSWIGWPNWLHSLVPHTRSWPLIATGVPVCAGWVVPVTGALRPDSLPAASRAVIVYVCVVEGASPLIVALVPVGLPTTALPALTVTSCQVLHAPVGLNAVAGATTVPLTAMSIGRLAVLPLAWRMVRLAVPASAAMTVHST